MQVLPVFSITIYCSVTFALIRNICNWLQTRQWAYARYYLDEAGKIAAISCLLITTLFLYGYFTTQFAIASLFGIVIINSRHTERSLNTHAKLLNTLHKRKQLPVQKIFPEKPSKNEVYIAIAFGAIFSLIALSVSGHTITWNVLESLQNQP